MIHGHGDDAYRYSVPIMGDFSSNIPYRHHADRVAAALREQLSAIENYPDPTSQRLQQLLQEHHALPSSHSVVLTNGSAEAFYLLAHYTVHSRSTVVTTPSFAEYEDACRLYTRPLRFIDIKELSSTTHLSADTFWTALPNNPNGYILPLTTLEALCKQHPDTLIIVDCAYIELTDAAPDLMALHNRYPHLVTVHSLTKTFAIPGLRIGYIVASKETTQRLQERLIPWSVNALAQRAGEYILTHYDELTPDTTTLCQEAQHFQTQLTSAFPTHLEVEPSPCNFFLCRLRQGDSASLKEYLVHQHGLLIRNADNFRGLTPQHFRLSVQSPEQNARLLIGLRDYFDQLPR